MFTKIVVISTPLFLAYLYFSSVHRSALIRNEIAQHTLTKKVVEHIFGAHGLNLPEDDYHQAEQIIALITIASPSHTITAALCVAHYLRKKLDEEQKEDKAALTSGTHENKLSLFFKYYITESRINYLTEFAHTTAQSLSAWQRLHHSLAHCCSAITHRLSFTQEWEVQCLEDALSQAVIAYIHLEEKYILNDYTTLLRFLVRSEQKRLPGLIDFWHDKTIQEKIATRLKNLSNTSARAQFEILPAIGARIVSSIAEGSMPLFLQVSLMSGGSMYAQWLNTQAQNQFALLSAKQKDIADAYQLFIKNLQQQRTKIINTIVTNFVQKQSDLKNYYQSLNQEQQNEYLYLMQSINVSKPKNHYLVYPITFDQLFAASLMNTPNNEQQPWFNVYQEKAGDWEYDAPTQSFWQRKIVPYGTPYWAHGSSNPECSSIFTEFISPATPYEVQVEVTLANVTYPFFAGVMVNKGRWISGDPERLTQYRLIGFYGTQTADTKSITLNFAEQKITNKTYDKKGNFNETILSPLQQISTDPKTQLWEMPPQHLQQLINQPLTYRFNLTLQPSNVSYAVSQKDQKGSNVSVVSGTLQGLDNFLSIFGGIGFMAAGCQAAFKIITPTSLNYSQHESNSAAAA